MESVLCHDVRPCSLDHHTSAKGGRIRKKQVESRQQIGKTWSTRAAEDCLANSPNRTRNCQPRPTSPTHHPTRPARRLPKMIARSPTRKVAHPSAWRLRPHPAKTCQTMPRHAKIRNLTRQRRATRAIPISSTFLLPTFQTTSF